MIRRIDALLAVLAGAAAFAQSLPSALTGKWQVSTVLIDAGATRTVHYAYNDPRLKGRLITISPAEISTDLPEDKSCGAPSTSQERTTAGALLAKTMNTRSGGKPATPEDYRLGIPSSASVDAQWIACSTGGFGPGGKTRGTWLLLLPDKRLAMRWYDESILVLSPLSAAERPTPSFDCAKASSPAEKAICGSLSLAAFDRSIADSYSAARKRYTDDDDAEGLKTLQSRQREWLAKRNVCDADAACLQKAMQDRLEALSDIR